MHLVTRAQEETTTANFYLVSSAWRQSLLAEKGSKAKCIGRYYFVCSQILEIALSNKMKAFGSNLAGIIWAPVQFLEFADNAEYSGGLDPNIVSLTQEIARSIIMSRISCTSLEYISYTERKAYIGALHSC
jgi:hypothetical protein